MAGSYKKDFDYSEAIANTSDGAERAQLLAERQNKIEAEGLGGKVAGNDAVSVWTGDYRPYSIEHGTSFGTGQSMAGSGGGVFSSGGLYDAAEQSRLKAFHAAQERIAGRLNSNLDAIESDYTAAMRQTDLSARHAVQGNEEKLAALGLNLGGRYDAPTSGAAETSRIALQNQYQSNLSALGQVRLSARAAAQQNADDQLLSLENGYYTGEASAALTRAQAQLQQFNTEQQYGLSVAGLTGYLNGVPTLGYLDYAAGRADSATAAAQTAATAAQTASANAYSRALERWKAAGYVLPQDAAVLGVPAGTATSDAAYKKASLSLQQYKVGL